MKKIIFISFILIAISIEPALARGYDTEYTGEAAWWAWPANFILFALMANGMKTK